MPRLLIGAAVLAVLSAGAARAQVTGPIPNTGLDDGPCCFGLWPVDQNSHSPEELSRYDEIERQYREVLARIPNKKPSNDPWKNIRQAPAAAYDRHRPQ